MDSEVDTFEQVDSFMKQQQKKIDSWLPFDNMLIPTGIMEQQEQKKVNMLRMIFKMLLINTRDVLNGLIVLEATNNMTSSMILHKTLIENTINIAYARKFYKTKDYHSFCNLIKGNKALFGNKTVNQKANISFVKSEGEKHTHIYLDYQETCKVAHPNFLQLINLLKNYDPEFSEEKLLTFDLNDKIFGEYEIKVIPISKTKIVNTIDDVMNEIAKEIVLKYNQDMFKVTSKLGEISLTPIQEKFDKLKDI